MRAVSHAKYGHTSKIAPLRANSLRKAGLHAPVDEYMEEKGHSHTLLAGDHDSEYHAIRDRGSVVRRARTRRGGDQVEYGGWG